MGIPNTSPSKMKSFIAAAAPATVTLADQPISSYAPAPQPSYPSVPAQYSYSWAVKDDYSGNDFGQNEERNDAVTTGQYYVPLPDGRLQKVAYTVDAYGGYQATVTYEGEASYPEAPKYKPAPAPAYAPAPVVYKS